MKKYSLFFVCLALTFILIFGIGFKIAYAGEKQDLFDGTLDLVKEGDFPGLDVKNIGGAIEECVNRYNSTSDIGGAREILLSSMEKCNKKVNISGKGITPEMLKGIMEEIVNSNPRLFHVDSSYQYSYSSDGNVDDVIISYSMTAEEYEDVYAVYQREIKKAADYVRNIDSDVAKIIGINDYICVNYEYDTTYSIYDVYGFITEKKGVCQAYTSFVTAVMSELNIKASYVVSEEMNHTWNTVMVDGKWYHWDVTWNDPVGGMMYYAKHTYMLLSDTEISKKEHYNWQGNAVCTSDKYDNFFWKNVDSPFAVCESKLYYISGTSKSLCVYNAVEEKSSTVMSFDYIWYAGGSNAYYSKMYSGLSSYNGLLFFNSPDALLMYDPRSEKLTSLKEFALDGASIYGSAVIDDKFYYFVTEKPLYTDKTEAIDMAELLPRVKVEWVTDVDIIIQWVNYGQIPVFPSDGPIKEPVYNYHYLFSGWIPSVERVYSDTVYIAGFSRQEHTFIDGMCKCGMIEPEPSFGFKTDDDGVRYYYEDGSYATGWTEIEGKTYRFNPENGLLFTEKVLRGTLEYYFNDDHSTVEGMIAEDGGVRFYKKGVRQYGWVDTDGNGVVDTYFYSTTKLRCEEDRVLFDGVATRRFYRYNSENGFMEVVSGYYTDENGTRFFRNGLGVYGWVTLDGEHITDKPGITLSGVQYFAYGDGVNFYRVDDTSKVIGGVLREFDENHCVLSYSGWHHNPNTGIAKYYVNGEMQQGWCNTPDGWVYLSRSDRPDEGRTYGDAMCGWRVIGGKTYYLRYDTSTPPFVVVSDAERELGYNGERSVYYFNQTPADGETLCGWDFYVLNPPA